MTASGLFVTGTDTGCGKTQVALALVQALQVVGYRAGAMKPVAAGATRVDGELRNDDAERLQAAADGNPDYADVNPVVFAPAIAPHLAAAEAGVAISLPLVLAARDRLAGGVDWLVVEGAGGWRVPLGADLDLGGLAGALGYPVILVVGMRLGCLNHAQLTAEAIARDGLPLAGWVANLAEPAMDRLAENIEALERRLAAPPLAVFDHAPGLAPAAFANRLGIDRLVGPGGSGAR